MPIFFGIRTLKPVADSQSSVCWNAAQRVRTLRQNSNFLSSVRQNSAQRCSNLHLPFSFVAFERLFPSSYGVRTPSTILEFFFQVFERCFYLGLGVRTLCVIFSSFDFFSPLSFQIILKPLEFNSRNSR